MALRHAPLRCFAAARCRADAPDVYEQNVVEGDEDAADAARLKLPQKRKKGGAPLPQGAAAGKAPERPPAPMAE